MEPLLLVIAFFFLTALVYASVGFGGGSTYNALLIIAGTDYRLVPILALICNIVVVTGGVWHFWRRGHIDWRALWPWVFLSVPAAWFGGRLPISEQLFIAILGIALLLSGLRMLWPESAPSAQASGHSEKPHPLGDTHSGMGLIPFVGGGMLGLLAGITGIGGGIFLAPLLHMIRWADAKQIAGTCSFFILVNSCAGLLGQISKFGSTQVITPVLADYWLLFPAVLVGGQIGSWVGASRISLRTIKRLSALLILYVAVRLLLRFW